MKTKNEGIDDRSETNELLAPASVGLFVLLYLSCLKATLWKPCINIFLKCREKSRSCTILLKFVFKIKVGPCLLGLTKVFFVSDVKLNSALTVKELCYVERIKWPTACVVVGTTRAATCSSGFLAVIALLTVWEWFMELVMASKDLSKIFQGARLDPITYQRKMISLLGLGALPFAVFLPNPFCFPCRKQLELGTCYCCVPSSGSCGSGSTFPAALPLAPGLLRVLRGGSVVGELH